MVTSRCRETTAGGPRCERPRCRQRRVEGMRDSPRDILWAQRLRRTMRTKLQRAIQEVVGPLHAEQMRELASLRQEVSELRSRLIEDMGELVRSTAERVIDQ